MARMHVVQVAAQMWLVLDSVVQPRYLIVEGPLVHKATGETHMKHRVLWWSLDHAKRSILSVHDGLEAAKEWCREQLERPDLRMPDLAPDGRAISAAEQRARWESGLDPRTGKPRTAANGLPVVSP